MTKKSVVIVGAGIGGLATAMRLQASGRFQVTVLEKNDTVGGRANTWEAGGYRFDTGPSLLLMTDVYRDLFAACGADFDKLVPLVKMEPNYEVRFGDGTSLVMTSDLTQMVANLEAVETGAGTAYYRFLEDAGKKYRIGRKQFVEKNFAKASDFFTLSNLKLLGALNALDGMYAHVGKYFKDARLRQAFSMQSMYLGISPFEAPAVYTLLPYTELAEDGLYYPVGGVYRLPLAMKEVAEGLGVVIQTNVNVTQIMVKDGRAQGVCVAEAPPLAHTAETHLLASQVPPEAGGLGNNSPTPLPFREGTGVGSSFLPADIVISNVDLPNTYTDLLAERPAQYEEKRWQKDTFTSSAFMLYLGTDKKYPQLGHHNFFLSHDYKKNFDEIFHAKVLPRDPSFYVNCPARTDPSVAPEGGDNLFVLFPVPHITPQMQWTPDDIAHFREKCYSQMAKHGIELDGHVVVERIVTPHDWKEQYNLKYGAAFGLSHGILQVGYFRPPNKAAHVGGLYFVGASTAPGTGVPLVCIGAKLVAERILADTAHA